MVKLRNDYGVINWPTTDNGWCEWFLELDTIYNTPNRSDLHHDNRCPIHKNRNS